jgi:hypothetical protein
MRLLWSSVVALLLASNGYSLVLQQLRSDSFTRLSFAHQQGCASSSSRARQRCACLSMQLDPVDAPASSEAAKTTKKGLLARAQNGFERTRPNLGIASEGQFLLLSAAVGVLTGTTVTFFKLAIGLLKKNLYGDFVGAFPIGASQLVVLLIPLLGALGVVLVKNVVPKRDFGPGIGGLIEEVDRQVPFDIRRAFGKSLAAIATLGTGNSLGPEGPAVGKPTCAIGGRVKSRACALLDMASLSQALLH